MTTKEILLGAAEYLRVHGWVQRMGDPGGPRCAVGAVISVHQGPERLDAYAAFADAAGIDLRALSIGDWNDAPGRTAEEVIAAFERAAGMEAT